RSLVSLVHVAASSSASVNACLLLIYSHSPVGKSSDLVCGVSRIELLEDCRGCGKSRRPAGRPLLQD
ncbi:MAG: hypothetical protein ACI3ZP_02985, partial [Candidatus Cryptobacteroides sp.]